jgi:hypothetical protein
MKNFSQIGPLSLSFNSKIIPAKDLDFGTKRLLDVDNRLVLPTDTMIKTLVTSVDVLHSFAVPQLGFKVDAVPGRLNQILLYVNRPGIYYGQCSELCGIGHGFMPIVVDAYLPEQYRSYMQENCSHFLNNTLPNNNTLSNAGNVLFDLSNEKLPDTPNEELPNTSNKELPGRPNNNNNLFSFLLRNPYLEALNKEFPDPKNNGVMRTRTAYEKAQIAQQIRQAGNMKPMTISPLMVNPPIGYERAFVA